MVDYSKWDKFVADLSSDEEEYVKAKPRITAFDKPTAVTIGPSGLPSKRKPAAPSSAPRIMAAGSGEMKGSGSGVGDLLSAFSKNGASCEGYCWSQTSDAAVLRVWVPLDVVAKRVRVRILAKPKKIKDEKSADKLANATSDTKAFFGEDFWLSVDVDKKPVVEGQLGYPVVLDDDYDGGVDWQLETEGERRWITVDLVKKNPLKGVKIWWSRLLTGETGIDLQKISDRRKSSSQMKKNWEEAHRLFQQKVSKIKPTYLDDNGHVVQAGTAMTGGMAAMDSEPAGKQ